MTPTNHPAPESEREAVKQIIRDGFNSGSSITAIADAILSRRTSELDAACNACLELAAAHGLATGHGDTVADMIRELFDGLLSRRGEPVAWRLPDFVRESNRIEGIHRPPTAMSGWPAGYISTVINGRCGCCGRLKRIRQYADTKWYCKECKKGKAK